jgi:hypothetical protein
MNKPASKIAWVAAAMAIGFALTVSVRAADRDDAAKKEKRDAEMLKKYDKNGNGKLDPDEVAAMKADQAKAKAEKEKERKKKENGSK